VTTAREQKRGRAVEYDADRRNDCDDTAIHGMRFAEPVNRLPRHATDREQDQHRVRERRHDRRAAQAVGPSRGPCALGERHRAPGHREPEHVTEVVGRVREEGRRMSDETGQDTDDDEDEIEGHADRERPAGIVRRRMMMMAVVMVRSVAVIMIVVVGHGVLGCERYPPRVSTAMAHLKRDREKLLARVKKIRGQLNAVEKAITDDGECSDVLMTLSSCHGALKGLMCEILEGHIRDHVVDPDQRPDSKRAQAAAELIEVLHSYLR
jgi:FrmR/RcnR family transcriptional regulator, repressor of frmRAB operon